MKQVLSACVLLVGFAIAGAGGAVAHAQEAHAADEGASFKALNDEFMLAIKNFYGKLEELEKAGEDTASYERESHPRLSFIERFEAGAKQHAGSEEAVPYLVWLVQFGGGSEQAGLSRSDGSALDTLIAEHATSEHFTSFLRQMPTAALFFGRQRCLAIADRVLSKVQDGELALLATFARGGTLLEGEPTEPEIEKARADLKKVAASDDADLARLAAERLFELENLSVGCVAPEIEGTDTDGVAFKLSDYRGKVVMLDFWGDW